MKELAYRIRKILRIIVLLQKNNLMASAAYRQNFVIMIVAVVLSMATNIIFLKVVYSYINNIAGWDFIEVILIIGSAMIVEGLLWIFGARIGYLGESIKNGNLDGLIVKPVDTQFLVSFWKCDHEDASRLVMGVALIAYALNNINLDKETLAANMFFYLILLFNATIINYSITLLLKTVYFWTIADYSMHSVVEAISQMSKYPTDVFANIFLKSVFTFLIPLAFIATVPARVLARGFDWKLVLGSCIAALVFFVIARKFWLKALKHYQSASS